METLAADLRSMQRTPLAQSHIDALSRHGEEKHYAVGETVLEVGQPLDRFCYVVSGELELVNPFTGARHLPHGLGPTQFAGEIGFLSGDAIMMGVRAAKDSVILEVPRDATLQLMAAIPEMSDIIMTVFAARRRRLLDDGDSNLTLIGADQTADMRRVTAFIRRNRLPANELQLGSDEARAAAKLCGIDADTPAVLIGATASVEAPCPSAVARALGMDIALAENANVDVLIVGGGPGGVAAGVYAGAEGLQALVVDELAIGGQAGTSSRIENYMGFPTGISGADLVWRGEIQAMKFGTKFAVPRRVQNLLKQDDGTFCAELDDGFIVNTRAVVVATGVQYRRLPLARLECFEGMGVYYAATESEARYCRQTDVIVVGGGNSAGQAAMFLSRTANHVHVLVRGRSLASSMSDYLLSRLEADPAITIHYQNEIHALHGDSQLEHVDVVDTACGAVRKIDSRAVFLMVGAAPNTTWLKALVAMDPRGFVYTGTAADQRRQFETSCPGVFAIGDVRANSVKRVASAVGEGSVVISEVWSHLGDD
ncbi:MAG: FAD-dependent oxidoreductase [Pseudomonadota bacterium]